MYCSFSDIWDCAKCTLTGRAITGGKPDRAPELAAELVHLKVDIIVVAAGGRVGPSGHQCDQDDSQRYGGQEEIPVAARALKLIIRPWEVRAADDLDKVFAALKQAAPGWTLRDREAATGC